MTPAVTDTIVAVSSPPGASARGLIRISGPATTRIAQQLIVTDTDRQLPQPRRLTPVHFRLRDPDATLPVLLALFASPNSYTGDDLVELQCPGNPALLERMIHHAIARGARLAEPGEFTFRAFVAGKLDLTQAEGVAATIAATSDSQLKAATQLRRGELGRFAEQLVDRLATQLALVEAGIDFVDQEDVVPIRPGNLDDNLASIEQRLNDLLRHSRSWGALEALPRAVLAGGPSVGKSTLFNALLEHERAVTAASGGTTRDLLEEPLTLTAPAGRLIEVMLTDIAGLDRPTAALDRQVQAAARDALGRADLILLIDDGRAAACPVAVAANTPTLHVRTKSDLLKSTRPAEHGRLYVSAMTGQGLGKLRAAIADRLAARGVSVTGQMLALQPRHEASLRAAADQLAAARRLLEPQRNAHATERVELVAGCMRHALNELAALGGAMTPDDVIGRVFATFCVGK